MTFERAYLTPDLTNLRFEDFTIMSSVLQIPQMPQLSHLLAGDCNSIPKYQLPVSTYKFEPTPITLHTNCEAHTRGKPPKDTRVAVVGGELYICQAGCGGQPTVLSSNVCFTLSTKKSDGKSCRCNRFVSLSIDMHKSSVRTSHRLTARDVGNNFGRRKYFKGQAGDGWGFPQSNQPGKGEPALVGEV